MIIDRPGPPPGQLSILNGAGATLASATSDESGVAMIDLKQQDLNLAAGTTVYIDVSSAGGEVASGAASVPWQYEVQIARIDGTSANRAARRPFSARRLRPPRRPRRARPPRPSTTSPRRPTRRTGEAAATSAAELALAAVGAATGPMPSLAAAPGDVLGGDPTPQVAMQDAQAVELALAGLSAGQAVAVVVASEPAPAEAELPVRAGPGRLPPDELCQHRGPCPGFAPRRLARGVGPGLGTGRRIRRRGPPAGLAIPSPSPSPRRPAGAGPRAADPRGRATRAALPRR